MKLCRYCCSILHISINDLDDCAGKNVSWVGPVYLVIFPCWGGPVPYFSGRDQSKKTPCIAILDRRTGRMQPVSVPMKIDNVFP